MYETCKTYESIRLACPELAEVERIAEAAFRDGLSWGDLLRQIEPDLFRMVGFGAKDPRLRSAEAYQVVLERMATIWAEGLPERNTLEICPAGA